MTKLWILSDLHQDHGAFSLKPPAGADVAVVAGDVVNDAFLIHLSECIPVVFVAGNHEFYGRAYDERMAILRDLPVTLLNNSSAVVEGVVFIGATLWTDYGHDPLAAEAARRGMNDHRRIAWSKDPWQRFLPSHATRLHEESVAYLTAEFQHDATAPVVVVTHHAPSVRSVHSRFASGPHEALNRAYYSDLDDLVEASGAALWIHGHVHNNFAYMIGGTRVLCNPHGYPTENPAFDPALVVEV